jgi:hypothetical protein
MRHYGILSSAAKVKSLAIIREQLGASSPKAKDKDSIMKLVFKRMGITPGICKSCKGNMMLIDSLPNKFRQRQRAPPNVTKTNLVSN